MTLAARLNRLRAQGPVATARAAVDGVERVAVAPPPGDAEALAHALHGSLLGPGLIVSETKHDLGFTPACLRSLARLPETHASCIDDWVYIDTETTGLSGGVGTIAFMVGVARYLPDACLQVRQYTLAGFAGEQLMLRDLATWVGDRATLGSYNGRCFDLPLLAGRLQLHRQRCALPSLMHLDLMYGVRRAYRQRWPDCRLQTAEQRRLGITRIDDLPGAQAPLAWQRWLREGDPTMLVGVLAHNGQDLVSLARLHHALVDDYADAERKDLDPGGVGRAWQAAGRLDLALALWERHSTRLDEAASLRLASVYRQSDRWREAESVWLALHRQGSRAAALALSKYHEHRRRDYGQAMQFAAACGDGADDRRRQRLRRKLGLHASSDMVAMVNLELPLSPVGATRTARV